MRVEATEWTKYKGLELKDAPIGVRRTVGSATARLNFEGLTQEQYFYNRTNGLKFCWYCVPHWQDEKKFKQSTSSHCIEHYRFISMDHAAERTARKVGADPVQAVKNIISTVGSCLICKKPFKKKKNSSIQFCRTHGKLALAKVKAIKCFTKLSKTIENCPPDYVERRMKGELYCKVCKDFWMPKTEHASVCTRCKPPEKKTLGSCRAKWRIFAINNHLDVEKHVQMMTDGYKICRKCFFYNTPEDYKLKCKSCKKNPRCAWAVIKGSVRRV